MRRIVKGLVAGVIGASAVLGVSACDSLPDIDVSRLPDISLPARPSETAEPQPTETVTEAPVAQPTETVTEAPAPSETASASPSASPATGDDVDDGSLPWWLWLLAGAAALVLVILVWRVVAARRSWDRQLERARAEVSWFEDSLVPQVLAKPTAAEAAQTWQAARPRVLDADRQLHGLIETAPTDDRRGAAERGLAVVGELSQALDAEAATRPGDDAETLRSRRAAVDAARAHARDWAGARRT
ncbi:hypothetical protein QQX10_03585 [Demequina sp. SYSU T00039]|uniref:DUF4129 domain-containing protein n=1 Tax=Demequina lignilytica TaxID=3051663 RepID=A0AAW7M1G7_9MICO|nr:MULTISPECIES: hypothetical protein [unclassified Demequina]MDN4477071.1 hypothetical protein [Demequina sp. SYSU T00039-1]MDN4487244.1 hypothetical protein [Demequina sp. SYSU T00039]MDN4491495.1 hypothetical protein [Demequina sp. SYSU T00068]